MDTFAIYQLHKKIIYLFLLPFYCVLLNACTENCDDMGATAWVEDLITLLPEKESYQQGEDVTLTFHVPSKNNYLGREADFYGDTGDASPDFYFDQLFIGNTVTVIKGKQRNAANRFYKHYN